VLPGPLFEGAFSWLSALLMGALKVLWGLLSGFALTNPDVTWLPQVREVSGRCLLVVVKNTVYVLAVLAAAILVMTRETVQIRYGIADLAPCLLVGLVAANLSVPLWHRQPADHDLPAVDDRADSVPGPTVRRARRRRPLPGRCPGRASRSDRSAASCAAMWVSGSPRRPRSASRRRVDSSRAALAMLLAAGRGARLAPGRTRHPGGIPHRRVRP